MLSTGSSHIKHNYFDASVGGTANCINAQGGTCERNILVGLGGSQDGIRLRTGASARHNSIFCTNGSGQGITTDGTSKLPADVSNNIVEGFSNGGTGYDFTATSTVVFNYQGNRSFNNATHYDAPSIATIYEQDNIILLETAFIDGPGGDLRTKDVGGIKEGALPIGFAGQ